MTKGFPGRTHASRASGDSVARGRKCLRTTNPIERLNGEFKLRVKTQCSLPSDDSALLMLYGLMLAEQIRFRRIDGWQQIVQVYRRGIDEEIRRAPGKDWKTAI